jgi:SDR family mycofactocin-dependent oxidoreductase
VSGRLAGRVALVTGGARGQGRAHALRLAEDGADIVVLDRCAPIDGVSYPLPTPADLDETVKLVEELDRRIVAVQADVRDLAALGEVVDTALDQFGRIDIVVANAGIAGLGTALELSEHDWQVMLDVNLTGVWKTVKAAGPAIVNGGRGGAIVLTSSVAGVMAHPGLAHYVAAKHGVLGLMKALAVELAPHRIRVNAVLPTHVDTPMIHNPVSWKLFTPDAADPSRESMAPPMQAMHGLPIPWVEPRDIADAVAWLVSDEARYVTGVALPVDGGVTWPFKAPHLTAGG